MLQDVYSCLLSKAAIGRRFENAIGALCKGIDPSGFLCNWQGRP